VTRAAWCLAILLAVATHPAGAKPEEPLDIYVVRGETARLERFKSEVASEWRGGKFLEPLSSGTEHRYWAFPTRTAPEARQFIFGSMSHGVQLDFEAYQEQTYFPKERAALNVAVSRCRLASDPFFIEPDRTLVVEEEISTNSRGASCIRAELNKADVRHEMIVRYVTKPKRGER
jgi:hypothetical protein